MSSSKNPMISCCVASPQETKGTSAGQDVSLWWRPENEWYFIINSWGIIYSRGTLGFGGRGGTEGYRVVHIQDSPMQALSCHNNAKVFW